MNTVTIEVTGPPPPYSVVCEPVECEKPETVEPVQKCINGCIVMLLALQMAAIFAVVVVVLLSKI